MPLPRRKHYDAPSAVCFDVRELKNMARVALPSVFQQSTVSIGMMLVQSVVNSFGAETLAGYSAAMRIESICTVPMAAVGNAMSSYTAPLAVDGIPQHIEHPAQHALPHRDGDGSAPGLHLHAPADPLAGGEHKAADGVPADVLGHLHNTLLTAHLQPQGVLDGGHLIPGELDVHHRSLDLCHRPFIFLHTCTHLSGDVSPSALPGPGPRWRSL